MTRVTRLVALVCVSSFLTPVTALSPVAVSAQAQATPPIAGQLIDQAGGVGIAGADVALFAGTKRVAQTKSTSDGSFRFPAQAPGIYRIEARAEGYQGVRSDDIAVVAGASVTSFRAVLSRSSSASTGLREIGRVTTAAQRSNVSTSTTITQSLASDLVQKEGYVRIGDALGTLPGVNLSGLSSSVGDDLGIDIRGFGTAETQTLLDGHPLGPFGPGSGGFSFQVSPSFAVGDTRVTYGSGALGLYGTDSIGGTVDMQTINPTRTRQFSLTQGYGNQGKSLTNFQATGTFDKIGYALVHAVQGAYGPWKPGQRVQTAQLGNDLSDASLAAHTYSTSGNYLLRNDLLKLQYNINEKTQLTLSALDASSWNDKSGNGDNCYFAPNLVLARANAAASGATAAQPSTYGADTNGNPLISCVNSIAVNTNGGPACLSAADYAAKTYGLAGGGPGPWQAHRVQDYHARFTTQYGNNLLAFDTFTNGYSTDYNRNLAGGRCKDDPVCSTLPNIDQNKFIGGFNQSKYQTTGVLLSDDIVTTRNDLGFGYYMQHQRITSNQFDNAGTATMSPTYTIQEQPELGIGNNNFFVRDDYNASPATTVYANAWLKHSTVTNRTTFDPRVSFVFRTSPADVVRVTGGRSDGEPSPNLTQGAPSLNTTPQNISTCSTQIGVGSVSNAKLQPEQSTDLEIAFGHRFKDDSIVQVDAYSSNEKNRIFGGNLPVTSFPASIIPPNLLAAYLAQANLICNTTNASISQLYFGTSYNAANARFRGIEIAGRYRINRRFYADYTYDIQSGVNYDLAPDILASNIYDINGSQIPGLVLHKGSLGLDFSTQHGFEARFDTNYVGPGNAYGRPAFTYTNASLSQRFGRRTAVNLGIQNLFNQASSNVYSVGGSSIFRPENQFGTDTSPLDQALNNGSAATGLLPTSFTFSITQRI